LYTRAEKRVKLVTSPFDAMLDLVREVSQCAHGDRLLRRVLRVAISLGLVRHDHLRVGLRAKSARLQKRLGVPDALAIDVKAGLDVVDGIDDEVKGVPEVVVEKILRLWGNKRLVRCHLEVGVHGLGLSAGCSRLGAAHIWLSEQELTVQVGYLDVVVIGDSNRAVWSARESHKGHSFNVFTTKSTGTDHESFNVSDFLLNFTSVNPDLVIVTAVHRFSVGVSFCNRLEAVVMSPLLKGHVLASKFDNFLRNEATEHGSL